ncbi:YHS domain-containing (seleno)protein [Thalassotalea euphylliae]|uniref:YHS domain-containing (seleno)protein n=1 Tax=Thalassotalea euphylliae TaxID=1655234 RepID=UPI003645EE7F
MKTFTLKSIAAGLLLSASSFAFAADIDMNADANDLAIKGFDPVAYFTMDKAVNGSPDYTATYKGAIYQFSSESHRDMFRANPAKYAPQYGGYCAFGVAMEKKFDTDPNAWKIIADKLYLNLNKDVQKRWAQDTTAYIEQSDSNWFDIKNKTVAELSEAE